MSKPPIQMLFVLGPSGVGKSHFADFLEHDHGWLHLDIDPPSGDGIDVNSLRKSWNQFFDLMNPSELVAEMRDRTEQAGRRKCVLSFSSLLVLSPEHIAAAGAAAIRVVYLYGPAPVCIKNFLEREQKLERNLNLDHWLRCNRTYLDISCPQFEGHRVNMFDAGGNRRSLNEVLGEIEK